MVVMEKWAETFEQRGDIEEFFQWLGERGIFLTFDDQDADWKDHYNTHLKRRLDYLLDEFFGINRGQLEKERCKLLEEARRANKR